MKTNLCDAIILAAGTSKRYSKNNLKQLAKINGKKLINISIDYFLKEKKIQNIYVVVSKQLDINHIKHKSRVIIINGGSTRTKSVYKALCYIDRNTVGNKNIIIHDCARPCIDISDIKNLIKCSSNLKTGIGLGYPLTNALKVLNKKLIITDNIKRDNMFLSFTPQICNFLKLFDSYKKVVRNNIEVDDELEAMHINSYKVKIMISSPRNIKLTYKEDLKVLSDLMVRS